MRTIGITGGIGAGKSELLSYIQGKYRCRVIRADETAHELEMPGKACYKELVGLLGRGVLNPDRIIDPKIMAEKIFSEPELLSEVNNIVHPAVKEYILGEIKRTENMADADGRQTCDFMFIEAALLIEEHYDLILDELWYIYADPEVRRKRLKDTRKYSDGKISDIFKNQLPETVFRGKCRVVINNSGSLSDAYGQIDHELGEYLCQKN